MRQEYGKGPMTWELGGGSGHAVNLRPFVSGLEAAGHKVFVAMRDLSKGPACSEATRLRSCKRPIRRTLRGT